MAGMTFSAFRQIVMKTLLSHRYVNNCRESEPRTMLILWFSLCDLGALFSHLLDGSIAATNVDSYTVTFTMVKCIPAVKLKTTVTLQAAAAIRRCLCLFIRAKLSSRTKHVASKLPRSWQRRHRGVLAPITSDAPLDRGYNHPVNDNYQYCR